MEKMNNFYNLKKNKLVGMKTPMPTSLVINDMDPINATSNVRHLVTHSLYHICTFWPLYDNIDYGKYITLRA